MFSALYGPVQGAALLILLAVGAFIYDIMRRRRKQDKEVLLAVENYHKAVSLYFEARNKHDVQTARYNVGLISENQYRLSADNLGSARALRRAAYNEFEAVYLKRGARGK